MRGKIGVRNKNTRCAHIFEYPRSKRPHHRYATAELVTIGLQERANTPQLDDQSPYKAPEGPVETWAHNLLVHPAPHGGLHRYSRRSATIAPVATIPKASCDNISSAVPKSFRTILLFVPQRLQQGQLSK